MLCAQTYDTVSGKDGRLPKYYYPEGWIDSCILYYETTDTPESLPNRFEDWGSFKIGSENRGNVDPNCSIYRFTTYKHCVDGPAAFTGVAVMIDFLEDHARYLPQGTIDSCIWRDTVYPDTVYILCPDTAGELTVVGSVSTRWDTATRKVWKFPINVDSAVYGFRHVYLYDLKFDHPVVVDSLYYIFGTNYNYTLIGTEYNNTYWLSHPYAHAVVWVELDIPFDSSGIDPLCTHNSDSYISRMIIGDKDTTFVIDGVDNYGSLVDWWGPYLLMIDSATIVVESANLEMGTAGPTRSMSKWVTQTITATPEYGYRFSHWNDGNTDNPRDVYLTQDTLFTAYFEPKPRYMVVTGCVPEDMGMVLGGGQYWCDDTVTLTATGAIVPYLFDHWNDGSCDNPRQFVIGQDTAFTAYFVRQDVGIDTVAADGLFTLTPNPATGRVTVESSHRLNRVVVYDLKGNAVLEQESDGLTATFDVSTLAKGVYVVAIHTPAGIATKRLVVE